MKSGAPAFVLEFDTAQVSFNQFVTVVLTNTGGFDTFASVTLTPTFAASSQQVSVDLPAGVTTETRVNAIISSGRDASDTCWLSILSESDQVVPTASFMSFNFVEVARYLPGDFAVFNLLDGRTRQC